MPIYSYSCPSCGPFDALVPLEFCHDPSACPGCGNESRRAVAMPHLSTMNASLRTALARSEKSGSEPQVVNKKHLAGCGCALCKMGPRGNQVRKKWSIGH